MVYHPGPGAGRGTASKRAPGTNFPAERESELETNALTQHIDDLKGRVASLRGYL